MQISEWYEVRASPDKGLGAFAKKTIPSGTLILADPPHLMLTIDQFRITEADINVALSSLSPEQKEAFHALSAPPTHYSSDIVRKFLGNSMSPAALPGTTCLCLNIARFNHSCLPNAEVSYNPFTHTFDLYAVREIVRDEEIMWCYLPGSSCMPRSYRQFLQFLNWRFLCNCAACCSTEPALRSESDQRRTRMYELRNRLEGFELGRLGPGTIEQRGIPLNAWRPGELENTLQELWRPPEELSVDVQQEMDNKEQSKLWLELVRLLTDEGLKGKELAMVYLRLTETAFATPDMVATKPNQVKKWMDLTMHTIRASRPEHGPDVEAFERIYTEWALNINGTHKHIHT